jgi:hypothetical protein
MLKYKWSRILRGTTTPTPDGKIMGVHVWSIIEELYLDGLEFEWLEGSYIRVCNPGEKIDA